MGICINASFSRTKELCVACGYGGQRGWVFAFRRGVCRSGFSGVPKRTASGRGGVILCFRFPENRCRCAGQGSGQEKLNRFCLKRKSATVTGTAADYLYILDIYVKYVLYIL